jgi:hypothetical protein
MRPRLDRLELDFAASPKLQFSTSEAKTIRERAAEIESNRLDCDPDVTPAIPAASSHGSSR